LGSSLSDELRLATGSQSKVIGIALKDRSAILPVGKRPTAAYWFDEKNGGFVTSSLLRSRPSGLGLRSSAPSYAPKVTSVANGNDSCRRPRISRSRPDDAPEEKSAYGNVFPYTITGGETTPGAAFFAQFSITPFANEFTLAFAKAAIENENLGADAVS
jgi:hypothetical protein